MYPAICFKVKPFFFLQNKFIGDPVGELSQSVKLPATPDEKFGVFARDADGTAPSPNWVRVSNFADESEIARRRI